ncbi:hypothetical protein CL630_00960 [bacterium]|nr:hypothetical protein [bacterium]
MFRDTFFKILFFVLLTVAVVNFFGNAFFLYWEIPWLDLVSHFGGGFWAGGMVLWLYQYPFPFFSQNTPRITRRSALIVFAILGAFVIGMWWEIYEVLIYPAMLQSENYFFDTITDLLMDTAGGLTAAATYLLLHKHDFKSQEQSN